MIDSLCAYYIIGSSLYFDSFQDVEAQVLPLAPETAAIARSQRESPQNEEMDDEEVIFEIEEQQVVLYS